MTREEIDLMYDHWLANNQSAIHFYDCHGFGREAWHAAFASASSFEAVEPIIQELAAIADACADLQQNLTRPDSDPVMGWDNAKLTLGTLRKARMLRDGSADIEEKA